jgi:hypothetical protein
LCPYAGSSNSPVEVICTVLVLVTVAPAFTNSVDVVVYVLTSVKVVEMSCVVVKFCVRVVGTTLLIVIVMGMGMVRVSVTF